MGDWFSTLVDLAAVFAPLSLISVGGGAAILGGIQDQVVNNYAWVTAPEFVELFAVSRASPGPGMMIAPLIGWKIAGWSGALVATLALFVPSSLLCYLVIRLTDAHREHVWYRIITQGLAPIGVGLTLAGLLIIVRITDGGLKLISIMVASTLIMKLSPKFPIIIILMAGGLAAVVI